LEVVLTPVSPDSNFIGKTDLYLVPGADDWTVGPGNRISVNAVVRSGGTYEIRMFSSQIPSDEFELRTSLR